MVLTVFFEVNTCFLTGGKFSYEKEIPLFLKSFVPVESLAAGCLFLDRLSHLYDLFADFVSDAFETFFK